MLHLKVSDLSLWCALVSLGVPTMDEAIVFSEKILPLLDTEEIERVSYSLTLIDAQERARIPSSLTLEEREVLYRDTPFGREFVGRLEKVLCLYLLRPELRLIWDRCFMEKDMLEQTLPVAPSSRGKRGRL